MIASHDQERELFRNPFLECTMTVRSDRALGPGDVQLLQLYRKDLAEWSVDVKLISRTLFASISEEGVQIVLPRQLVVPLPELHHSSFQQASESHQETGLGSSIWQASDAESHDRSR